jgi:hypothetical protein
MDTSCVQARFPGFFVLTLGKLEASEQLSYAALAAA